jgi:hypothetical protein
MRRERWYKGRAHAGDDGSVCLLARTSRWLELDGRLVAAIRSKRRQLDVD